jgi:HK97 family phage major capsid protein/HK97 family phage prohead protease
MLTAEAIANTCGFMALVMEPNLNSGAKFMRRMECRAETLDQEERTVELSFSSEEPYERYFGTEILDHDVKSIRMDRIKNSGPLLFNHDPDKHIGRVVEAGVKDGKGYAKVKFSKGPLGSEKLQDVQDGILKEVSVGYRIHAMQQEKTSEGSEQYRVTDWEPLEISLVTIPADTKVGVGRSDENGEPLTKISNQKNMETETQKIDVEKEKSLALEADRKRIAGIQGAADELRSKGYEVEGKQISEAIENGYNGDWLKARSVEAKKAVKMGADTEVLDKMQKETKRSFSLLRVLRSLQEETKLDGFEAEVCAETARTFGVTGAKGFMIPFEAFSSRSLLAGDYAAGGSFVPLEKGPLIEKLDPMPVVEMAGATVLRGISGPISFPRQTGAATAEWVAEAAQVNKSTPATDDVMLTPHGLSAYVEFSKQLALTSSIDVEAWVRSEILRRIYLAIDKAAIVGSGSSGVPKGVFSLSNGSGLNTVSFGGAPTWAKVTEFEGALEDDDALRGSLAWITSSPVKAKWKATSKDSGSGQYLADGNSANGYDIYVTSQLAGTTFANHVLFGNFSDMLVGLFGAVELMSDQSAALQRRGLVGITGLTHADVAVRHAESFCVSTDTGNQ